MRIFALCSLLLVLAAGVVSGQQPVAVGQLPATTVQLPSFSFFTVNTTVSVPDSGGAYLGGVNRARDGSTTRGLGPLRNRGIGAERAAGGVAVQATIHNLDELDRATLAEAAANRGAVDPDLAKAELIRRGVARTTAERQGIAATK